MKKFLRKSVSLMLAAGLVVSACSCGKKDDTVVGSNKVTYWVDLSANASQTVSNMAETEFSKKLMNTFGTTIEYQHPAQGQLTEKFNVMIAMGSLPDIIEYSWNNYSGGVSKALSDGVIMELDPKKDAPNLYKYLQENPEIDKMCKTDDGKYYGFPFIRGDEYLLTSAGIIVREDWLKDAGLELPETIDEWTQALRAFKKIDGVKAPLALDTGAIDAGCFIGAYNTYNNLYIRDGQVVFGPMEDSYKDFLTQMNSWYKEGLIDPDFAGLDSATKQSNILNGVSGATYGSCGGNLGKWMAAATSDKFSLTGTKYPVMNKGDKPEFGQYQNPVVGRFAAISKDCKNPELCMKILDYGYSEEGQKLFNFGIEGESYNVVDGYPTYTEKVTQNEEGLSMSAALAKYALSHFEGPFIQDKRYMEQYANLPQQHTALENWSNTNMSQHMMPALNLTATQLDEISSMVEAINTYKSEMLVKFIMGIEPIENFETFRNELKNRGIDKYVQYYQESYDRYLAR